MSARLIVPLQAGYDIVHDANYDIVMSYDNLMRLQDAGEIAASLLALGAVAFLVAGLIRPPWVRLARRLWVAPIAVLLMLLALVLYAGVTVFTHSQPNGPHAFGAYMDAMTAEMCIRQPAHKDCDALRTKCERRDPTHPPCRVLAGEDPRKFYAK